MSAQALIAVLTGAAIATVGLWWFRLVLPGIRNQPPATRFGVYAAVWLAYFILSIIIIGRAE